MRPRLLFDFYHPAEVVEQFDGPPHVLQHGVIVRRILAAELDIVEHAAVADQFNGRRP